jgi:hypothetical protein
MDGQTLVTCFIIHVIRDSKLIWTIPESFSRESAEAYVTSFNASEKTRSHAERMVIVEQHVKAESPPELVDSQGQEL